eukprot:6871402-Lingulodinium_polyedra.AAC.1
MRNQTCTRSRNSCPTHLCTQDGHMGRPLYGTLVWLARACGQWQLHLGPVFLALRYVAILGASC